ncbi:MAG: NAD(P)-binding protein [Syntrophales bacterium]
MADKNFDVVIVGGGNKALIAAMYLTKYAKLEVGIFEERNELGGGWCQEEPAPGFLGNPCSAHMTAQYHIPTFWDFPEWEDYGVKMDYTECGAGNIFSEDDTCIVQYTAFPDVDPDQERTAAEIARFSRKDADTYLKLWKNLKTKWEPYILESWFNPPPPPGQPDAIDRMVQQPDSGLDPSWFLQSPIQMNRTLWEDSHVRHAFGRCNESLGFEGDQAGSGFAANICNTLMYWPMSCWIKGSTHVKAHASQKIILENGGRGYTNSPVDHVIIKNGRAVGIKLEDGTEIEAKKAVLTDVDPDQLCNKLIGKDHISSDLLRKINALERDYICIMWYTWAFKERPRYKAEAWNPDCWQTMWLTLGDMDDETVRKEGCERRIGKWPSKLNTGVAYHGVSETSPGDSLLAPRDINFTLITEQFVLPAWRLSEEEWKRKETEHAEEVVKKMHEYAPNVSWDIIGGYIPVTPYYTAHLARNFAPTGNWCVIDNIPSQSGRLRPVPELARNKVPGIEGLYCTGSAWPPFGAAHSMQGYNVYKVMAEDLHLPKPWDVDGRPF